MDGNRFLQMKYPGTPDCAVLVIFLLIAIVFPNKEGKAAALELSGMLSYSKTELPDTDKYLSIQRRYTGSVAFKFTAVSALELEYTYSTTKISYFTNIGVTNAFFTKEAITYEDRVYSFNWVQNLVSSRWVIQPYFVIGGGKMFRTYTREYPEFGKDYTLSIKQNVVSGTGGLGLRVFLTRNLALKAEVKTYVPNFQFSKWKQSQVQSVGLSWVF